MVLLIQTQLAEYTSFECSSVFGHSFVCSFEHSTVFVNLCIVSSFVNLSCKFMNKYISLCEQLDQWIWQQC